MLGSEGSEIQDDELSFKILVQDVCTRQPELIQAEISRSENPSISIYLLNS